MEKFINVFTKLENASHFFTAIKIYIDKNAVLSEKNGNYYIYYKSEYKRKLKFIS